MENKTKLDELLTDFHRLLTDTENVIDRDFEGFPVYKRTFRYLLEQFGFEHVDGYYRIAEDSPLLDKFPVTVEDDGMGYGVNEKFISEVNSDGIIFINEDVISKHRKEDAEKSKEVTEKLKISTWLDFLKGLGDDLLARELRSDAFAIILDALDVEKEGSEMTLDEIKKEVKEIVLYDRHLQKEYGFGPGKEIDWNKYQID